MGAFTAQYNYWYPTASEPVPPSEWEYWVKTSELVQLGLAKIALPKPGFVLAADYTASIGTGLEVIIGTGFAWVVTTDGPILVQNAAPFSVKAAQGLVGVAGAVAPNNWLWAQPNGSVIATQLSTTGPAGTPLAATAIVTDTAVTAVDSNPTGRVNLALRSFQAQVTGFDAPSIANGGYYSTTVTVVGVRPGDALLVVPGTVPVAGIYFPPPIVTANDTVRIHVKNDSGGAVDLASMTLTVFVWKY